MKFLVSLLFVFSVSAQAAEQVVLNSREVTIGAQPGESFEAIRTAQTPTVVTLHFAPHSVPYEVCDQYESYQYVCGHRSSCWQYHGRTVCNNYPRYCYTSRCVSTHTEYTTQYQNLTLNFKRSLPLVADQQDAILVNVYSYSNAGLTVTSSASPYKVKQGGTIFNGNSWYFAQGDQEARH